MKSSFDQWKIQHGFVTWNSPSILPLDIWVQELFSRIVADQKTALNLVDSTQRQHVWSKIIAKSSEEYPLLNISETEMYAQAAWTTANSWGYDFEQSRFALTDDQIQFISWTNDYLKFCKQHSLTDTAMLETHLCELGHQFESYLPKHIVLAGYKELTPQQHNLFEIIVSHGTVVEKLQHTLPKRQSLARVSPANDDEELRMAALWARQTLERNVAARIAVVIPDLHSRKTEVRYQFEKIFYPDLSPTQIQNKQKYFNISFGQPLNSLSLVKSALLIIKLTLSEMDGTDLTEFLLSSFYQGSEIENQQRSVLDADPKIKQRSVTCLSDLIKLALNTTPVLNAILTEIDQLKIEPKGPASYWVRIFNKILKLSGWPGQQSLTSEEYQQVRAFKSVLGQFSKLDAIQALISRQEALSMINRIASQSVFQAKTIEVPVQVLGMLEVVGLAFDKIWVCSMDSTKWPMNGSANPFLPLEWQKLVGAPFASTIRTAEYAQYQFDEIRNAARELIFSHVAMRDDNSLECTQIISGIELTSFPDLELVERGIDNTIFESKIDESIMTLGQERLISGGSALLSDQAACPFKSLVSHRLLARDFESSEMGINPRDRGKFIHKVLEMFWQETSNQKNLVKLTKRDLYDKINQLTNIALLNYENYSGLIANEKEHIIQVAIEWLELEKLRADFEVVSMEEKRQLDIFGLQLKVMIDRIDQVRVGGQVFRVIIDYKTGDKSSPNAWMLDRPQEVQLPLYVITDELSVDGASFAFLKRNKLAFKGYAVQENLIDNVIQPEIINTEKPRGKKVKISWEEALTRWSNNLKSLAEEIKNGHARVDPVASACLYCKFEPICRINSEDGERL